MDLYLISKLITTLMECPIGTEKLLLPPEKLVLQRKKRSKKSANQDYQKNKLLQAKTLGFISEIRSIDEFDNIHYS